MAGLGEMLIDLGSAFDGASFGAVGAQGDLIGGEREQDVVIHGFLGPSGGIQHERSPMEQGGQGAFEREPIHWHGVGASAVLQERETQPQTS